MSLTCKQKLNFSIGDFLNVWKGEVEGTGGGKGGREGKREREREGEVQG